MIPDHDTIVAPATAPGGAIAVVRVSGTEALACCDRIFRGREPLAAAAGYTVHYGTVEEGDRTIDDVLATVFRAPHSYTGEDSVEISCHGSRYIVAEILRLLLAAGARMAAPGEFTIRAYLAGKIDLSQAEAVADLIASSSRADHALATNQMRGGYSEELEGLRDKLLQLTSLLELELDFSEEDVEFADRTALRETMERIGGGIDRLRNSFALGNAIKEGVAVAIVGAPNVGKSTLMNALVGERLSIITSKAQTTRHRIMGIVSGDDFQIVYSDTPGILKPAYKLQESMMKFVTGAITDADVILYVTDTVEQSDRSAGIVEKIRQSGIPTVVVINKIDLSSPEALEALVAKWNEELPGARIVPVSAREKFNIEGLFDTILGLLPEGPAFYPKDTLTDKTLRFFASEIIREKILRFYDKEIPYCCEIEIESYREEPEIDRIAATIYVARESQKGIIIGHKGEKLKRVGQTAREDMEQFLGKKVFLQLFVKVSEDWRNNDRLLRRFGYELE